MLFQWLKIGIQSLVGVYLILSIEKKSFLFFPANILAITCCVFAMKELDELEEIYKKEELKKDTLDTLLETQVEQQLTYVESAAESAREEESADKQLARQIDLLQKTAPILTKILNITGQEGAITRLALGMMQDGASLGEVLRTTSDIEFQLEQKKLAIELQQTQQQAQFATSQATTTVAIAPAITNSEQSQNSLVSQPQVQQTTNDAAVLLQKSAAAIKLTTKCLEVHTAPSFNRYIFSLQTEDYDAIPKWEKATRVALGKEDGVHFYEYAPEQVAIELPVPDSDRQYFDLPPKTWKAGDRWIYVGQSLNGEVKFNLADEKTPQVLVSGTTGSGKSNFLRLAAYCLLMQSAKVDICGGKRSDYEDFASRFSSISMQDMSKTAEVVHEYYTEIGKRNDYSKEQLEKAQTWALFIDEYSGTVPYEKEPQRIYDQELSEIARRGRGLKIHIFVGLQRGAKRSQEDPQGLPPAIRDCLPARITFHILDATGGRMVMLRRGEIAPTLQGKGDGIFQSASTDTRFQCYRFEEIPI